MTIHKEGYTPIALCILLIFVLNAFLQFYFPGAIFIKWFVYTLSVGFFILTIVFFRNPAVDVATDEKAILSPANGKVIAIEEADESEYLKDRRTKITIDIPRANVHVNRNPVKGSVKYAAVADGQTTTGVELDNGATIVYNQIGGGLTKRVISYLKQGDTVEQGAQFGFAMLGSSVEVYLPIGTNIDVDIDDTVKAGQTVLARFKA